jgi:hypothetical protein
MEAGRPEPGARLPLGDRETTRDGGQTLWAEAAAFGLLLLICLGFGVWKLESRDKIPDCTWLIGEGSNPLYRAEQLSKGRILYRDVACQYGPLPVYLFTGWTLLFGNTSLAMGSWSLAWGTGAMLLMFGLVRRVLRPWWAFIVVLLACFQNLINDPGGIEYVGCERVLVLSFLLAWQCPSDRTLRGGVLLGLMLGTWQLTKFGGCFAAGGALLGVDVLWLLCMRPGFPAWSRWLWSCLAALLMFVAIQFTMAVVIFSLCPEALAKDTLWPYYLKETYASLPSEYRFPHWVGWKHFVVAQLPLLASLALTGLAVVFCARRLIATRSAPLSVAATSAAWPLLVGGLFYFLAMPAYLGNVWLWYKYQFTLVPAALAFLATCARPARLLYLLLFCPGVLVTLKSNLWQNPVPGTVVRVSDRMTIDVPRDMSEEFAILLEKTATINSTGKFVVFFGGWGGGAFHIEPNSCYDLRSYLVAPLAFRDYDRAELREKLSQIAAFVVYRYEADKAPDETIAQTLGPALWTSIQSERRPRVALAGKYFHIIQFEP